MRILISQLWLNINVFMTCPRPFACSYPGCTWRFKTESTCIAHLRGHSTVEGKFKCSKCGYAFRHKHHLKRHESKIHGLHPGKIAAPNDMSNEVIASSDSISKNQDVDVNDTVRLLLNTADGATDIGHALQPGNIVITTDTDGNPVNYHVTDIEISSGCETVLEQDKNVTVALCVQTPQEDPDQSHYVPLNISLTEELLTDIGTTENINTDIHTEIPETRTQSADVNQ
ncbi:hypothetical protein FSP39_006908 [Pinctada imbricata]|uniref:C2H2-type domain-containing protein n=1 Tax=Pinctada imbricata TaxID=66713 RepID=A0AA88XI35_PINIB|nr:hypothetical protein FSP39_006908 [Pinctada imbricata]